MPYIPNIPDYKSFYVQKDTDATAVDVLSTYGVVIQTHDYPMELSAKEPYKNEWYDENGDDEYTGDTTYYESFTFKAKCVIISDGDDSDDARQTLMEDVRAFQNYLTGQFKVYDSWTRFGFKNVRVVSFSMPSEGDFRSFDTRARVMFDVTFKVNDPKTVITYVNGFLVEAN